MIKLIEKEDVKKVIDEADGILSDCFEMLAAFRHAKENSGRVLQDFQPKLAECLYNLMQFYHDLQAEKKQLISLKKEYDKDKFSQLMSTNADYIKVVNKAIVVGKNLGDAFAWFFFLENRSELDKHFSHEPTGLYVSGIGGLGELEFVKNVKQIDGLYVIYHGITSMLRIGDFSLYDLDHGIVGVGELKTSRDGDKLTVNASITAKTPIRDINFNNYTSNIDFESHLNELQKSFPTIKKQVSMHSELMNIKSAEHSDDFLTTYEYELIDQLSKERPISINSDNSLLLYAQWSQYDDLFSALNEKESQEPPQELYQRAQELIFPLSEHNRFIVSSLNTQVTLLSIPLLWWDIEEKACKALYFNKMVILTIFNPAKLLQCFIDDGFTVSGEGELDKTEIQKIQGNHRIAIGNFESLCYLIIHSLMKTETVYECQKKLTTAMELGEITLNSKIEMQIHLNSFGKPEKSK